MSPRTVPGLLDSDYPQDAIVGYQPQRAAHLLPGMFDGVCDYVRVRPSLKVTQDRRLISRCQIFNLFWA